MHVFTHEPPNCHTAAEAPLSSGRWPPAAAQEMLGWYGVEEWLCGAIQVGKWPGPLISDQAVAVAMQKRVNS